MNRTLWIILSIILLGSVFVGVALLQDVDLDGHTNDRQLSVHPVEADQGWNGTVVEFDDLTPAQQRVFRQALNSESNSAAIPDGVNGEVWIENDAVRYQNQIYEVYVAIS